MVALVQTVLTRLHRFVELCRSALYSGPITRLSPADSTTSFVTWARSLILMTRSICVNKRSSNRKFPPVTRMIAAAVSAPSAEIAGSVVTLHEIRRLASHRASRESLILVQFSGCTKRGDHCTLIGDFVGACAVSHLDAEYWKQTRRAKTLVHIPQAVQIRPAQHWASMGPHIFRASARRAESPY